MSPVLLVVSFAAPIAILVVIFLLVFGAVRKAIDRAAEEIAAEGVELDSGQVTLTTRMTNFRAPGLISGGIRRNPARVVLTKQRLHLIQRPQRYGILERTDLKQFTVGTIDGKLHLHTDTPPGATGSVDYRVHVDNPARWVDALAAAGATKASTT